MDWGRCHLLFVSFQDILMEITGHLVWVVPSVKAVDPEAA